MHRLKLDDEADTILAGLKRWKACEQWQNPRFVPHPSTFLDQERWEDTPPAGEPTKGEGRLREMTPEQSARATQEARARAEYIRLARLPGNDRKSDEELCRLAEDAVRAA